jgi:hypothetical protein
MSFEVGQRVLVIKDTYYGETGSPAYPENYTGATGTIVSIDPDWQNPYEVELDHRGFSECFKAEEIEVTP